MEFKFITQCINGFCQKLKFLANILCILANYLLSLHCKKLLTKLKKKMKKGGGMGKTTKMEIKQPSGVCQYRSFAPGWNQVPIGSASIVRFRIIASLGLNSRQSFNQYLHGKVRISPVEAAEVERILREAGAKNPIWHILKK